MRPINFLTARRRAYAPWVLCTMGNVHHGQYALWAVCTMGNMHHGQCAQWAVCTMSSLHHVQYAPWAICTMGSMQHGQYMLQTAGRRLCDRQPLIHISRHAIGWIMSHIHLPHFSSNLKLPAFVIHMIHGTSAAAILLRVDFPSGVWPTWTLVVHGNGHVF